MMSRRRFTILALVFGLAAIPAFSCLTLQQTFTMASDSCCLIMNQHCKERMPEAARACCEAGNQDGQPYLSTAAKWQLAKAQVAGLPVRDPGALAPPDVGSSTLTQLSASPPRSSPGQSTILRI